MEETFVIRTLAPEELIQSQLLRAEVFSWEKQWIPTCRLKADGREEDPVFDPISIHGGAFMDERLVGSFRMIPRGVHKLPVERFYAIPSSQRAVELSRLAVLPKYRRSVAMIGLCRWIYGQAVDYGATHMYALMEFELISMLLNIGFPFTLLGEPHTVYKYSQDYVTVCPVADLVTKLAEADLGRRSKYAPLFAHPFDGEISPSMLYPETDHEMEVA
jgi:N-acyl-L-homoserine lactone synthetase